MLVSPLESLSLVLWFSVVTVSLIPLGSTDLKTSSQDGLMLQRHQETAPSMGQVRLRTREVGPCICSHQLLDGVSGFIDDDYARILPQHILLA